MSDAPDSELAHKIISLLKRGPYMQAEVWRYCRPSTMEAVDQMLWRMEANGTIRYLPAVGLWQIVAQ